MKLSPTSFTLSLGLFLAFGLPVAAGPRDPIREILAKQVADWNRGDIDAFMAGYQRSPETTFVSGNTVTHGWQTVRDRYAKRYHSRAKMGQLTFSDLAITRLSPEFAMVLGSWSLERAGDHPLGKFTLLFRKLPEGWRIVLDHTS